MITFPPDPVSRREEICKKMEISGTHLGVMLFRVRQGVRKCFEKKGLKKG